MNLRTVPTSLFAISLVPEAWVKEARCAYASAPDVFLGKRIRDKHGKAIMSEKRFLKMTDAAFHGEHDSRFVSGGESKQLMKAVTECLKCPVRQPCLRSAFDSEASRSYGIYGGTTSWERRAFTDDTNPLMSGLDKDQRIDLLERLVDAKSHGAAPLSVRVDYLAKRLKGLNHHEDLPEDWADDLERAEAETNMKDLT